MTDHTAEIDTEIGEVESGPEDNGQPRPRKRPRRTLGIGLTALVVAGAGAGTYALVQNGATDVADVATGPTATAEVVRETIADTRTFSATLGHGEAFTVTTPAQGVITGIADPGAAADQGSELFWVNQQPVTAMLGAIPMYRDLGPGAEGVDVEQLIDNLTDLGYADCEATDEYTPCVEAAVREWQADIGATETGRVGQSDVVFVPDGSRVDAIHANVADVIAPGTPILDLTGSEQVVSLEAEVRDRDLFSPGTEVTVQLPGGDQVPGTVTAANVVPVPQDQGGAGGADESITRVEVSLDEVVDDSLLGAPADVIIELGEREDVLTVPVNALLALTGGGHGLEVVHDDGTTSLVPVETGLFASGKVEVSGDGIDAGTIVGVAGR